MNLSGLIQDYALATPWALLLLIGVTALLAAELFARAPGALTVSTGETLASIRSRRGALLRRMPAILRAVGLMLLIIGLARPMRGYKTSAASAAVRDIMLCVDVSGSMKAMDFVAGGQRVDRLFVTKEAVRDFLRNRRETELDRVGLILYAGYAWTQCPLTLDYGVLERELELAAIDERDPAKQGTAIGSAIGLAVSRLRKSEAESRVIVLLTDGLNNRGELDPLTAARVAKDYGIRIYTIGAGTSGVVLIPQQVLFGTMQVPAQVDIDDETLTKIATATGGKYYRATDTASLQGAYAEINELEKTDVELEDYYEHEESFAPFALTGALALLASIISRRAWFEPLP